MKTGIDVRKCGMKENEEEVKEVLAGGGRGDGKREVEGKIGKNKRWREGERKGGVPWRGKRKKCV